MAIRGQNVNRGAWHAWYGQARWRKRAKAHLREHPLCVMCLHEYRYTAAQVVDHVDPHHGDEQKFFHGVVQSLCKLHHDGAKRRIETVGYDKTIGDDGWPIDLRHPVHTGTLNTNQKSKNRNMNFKKRI